MHVGILHLWLTFSLMLLSSYYYLKIKVTEVAKNLHKFEGTLTASKINVHVIE